MDIVMNYIEKIAGELREVLPDLPGEFLGIYALLVLVKGPETTLEDVHDAWSLVKTAFDPGHRSLIPFGELSSEVQVLDAPYRDAIRQVAREGKRA